MVKRVIGLEGDVVRVKTGRRLGWQRTGRGGSLYGRALMPGDLIVVPPGHCWVEGDGEISRDSNDFGAVGSWCFQTLEGVQIIDTPGIGVDKLCSRACGGEVIPIKSKWDIGAIG